jgi:hypothetical protein
MEIEHRPDLATEVRIVPRNIGAKMPEQYQFAVIVTIDQLKTP